MQTCAVLSQCHEAVRPRVFLVGADVATAAAAAADLVIEHAPDGLQEELLPRVALLPAAVLQVQSDDVCSKSDTEAGGLDAACKSALRMSSPWCASVKKTAFKHDAVCCSGAQK